MNESPASAQADTPLDTVPSTNELLLNSILRQADAYFAREEWLAAKVSLEIAVSIAPNKPELLVALGSLQFRLKEYPAACATFTAAIDRSSGNSDLYIQLAMVQVQLEKTAEAKVALRQSLQLKARNPIAREMLGDLEFAAGHWADAAEQYCAALEGNQDGVSLLLHLGKCQRELHDLASARWCFERVLSLDPTNEIASDALQGLAAKGGLNSPAIAKPPGNGEPIPPGAAGTAPTAGAGGATAETSGLEPQGRVIPTGKFRPVFAEPSLTAAERATADQFHDLYYSKLDSGRGLHTIVLSWMGYEMFKCPLDLWIYQELIVNQRPDVIIETGTYKGGSALFLASVCDCLGHGEVVTIDLDAGHQPIRPQHSRITYLHGSSTARDILDQVKGLVAGRANVLVILDSDHRYDHVISELRAYRQFVPVGGHLIVEDTNINGHPTYKDFGAGPWEAVDRFLLEDPAFVADRTCERFILTMNPRGFLRRTGV